VSHCDVTAFEWNINPCTVDTAPAASSTPSHRVHPIGAMPAPGQCEIEKVAIFARRCTHAVQLIPELAAEVWSTTQHAQEASASCHCHTCSPKRGDPSSLVTALHLEEGVCSSVALVQQICPGINCHARQLAWCMACTLDPATAVVPLCMIV
jgi:hypothetical protein